MRIKGETCELLRTALTLSQDPVTSVSKAVWHRDTLAARHQHWVKVRKPVAFSDKGPQISQDPNSQPPKDTRIKMRNMQDPCGANCLAYPTLGSVRNSSN